jgi:hypothetical protein
MNKKNTSKIKDEKMLEGEKTMQQQEQAVFKEVRPTSPPREVQTGQGC